MTQTSSSTRSRAPQFSRWPSILKASGTFVTEELKIVSHFVIFLDFPLLSFRHTSFVGVYIAAVTNKGTFYLSEFCGDLREGAMPTASMEDPKKKFAHKRYALKCKFSPDSTMLVTASADQTAKVWRTTDLKLITVNLLH